jgi:hypothetical protein
LIIDFAWEDLYGPGLEVTPLLKLTWHWRGVSHMATTEYNKGWEVDSMCVLGRRTSKF